MTANKTAHVLFHGRVQGVGFRSWTHHQAELHGLNGWVRNRRDGSVEAVFSGPDDLIDVMLKACHEGPRGSAVERVEALDGADAELSGGEGFEVRRTV
ncbi:acylphosphatase [Microvirga sp. 2YAF29]|uniref:acylphosphatase n=1 Tax=Microvirga sp. 2YAF29 TaxID=3233031 RepID=UPI003F95FD22